MVFNVVAHNHDDHVKNFAFLMDELGAWTLSPAYDLLVTEGPGGEHSMTLDGEGKSPTLEAVLRLASRHGVSPADARGLVERVHDAHAKWPTLAKQSGVTAKRMRATAAKHRHLR